MINVQRIFLFTAISLALSIVIFILNLLFFANPLHVLYADLFQSGQMYQSETRALMYNRFLLNFIIPGSLLIGGVLTWLLMKRRQDNSAEHIFKQAIDAELKPLRPLRRRAPIVISEISVRKRTALMTRSGRTIQTILLIAVLLIAPFATLEIYLVATIGMTEPYSYIWSIPLGVCSFILMQIALVLGVVKGWKSCITKSHYYLMATWAICALLIFALPVFFPNRLSFL